MKASLGFCRHVQLSLVQRHAPHCFASDRINASSRYITELDSLPVSVTTAKVIYLSNNFLTDLKGVEQFFCVEKLSLASNRLERFDVLHRLYRCTRLKELFLHGNPIAKLPLYRCRVLSLMRAIKIPLDALDGKAVKENEITVIAAAAVQRHASMLSVLVQQECRVLQLSYLAKSLCVQRELLSTFYGGRARPCYSWDLRNDSPFDCDIILRYACSRQGLRVKKQCNLNVELQALGYATVTDCWVTCLLVHAVRKASSSRGERAIRA